MISVPNHLRPLNGNRYGLLLFLVCLLMVACDATKRTNTGTRTTNTSRSNANTNTGKGKSAKVDTIRWKENAIESDVVVMTDQDMPKANSYNITIFVPFDSENYSQGDLMRRGTQEHRFANYYAGIKMALDDLERDGVSLNVTVKDSEAGDFTKKLNNEEKADVIIGPYDRTQLKQTAEFCKRNNIVNISPWQSSSKITSGNAYHVQLRPNQTAYYDAIVRDAISKFPMEQIYLIGRNTSKDKGRNNYFQKTAATLKQKPEGSKPLQAYTVDPDSLINDALTFDETFLPETRNALIFPQWSSEDESFIYDCLRKLAIEKGMANITVYGMPIMIDSEKITFDYFQNLDIRVARAKWVDKNKPSVKDFRRRFFQIYNALPADDALDGYDMMTFIGSNLWKNGTKFQYVLDQDRKDYLQTSFEIQKVIDKDSRSLDNFKNINYFENRNLDIIGFQRDRLVKM